MVNAEYLTSRVALGFGTFNVQQGQRANEIPKVMRAAIVQAGVDPQRQDRQPPFVLALQERASIRRVAGEVAEVTVFDIGLSSQQWQEEQHDDPVHLGHQRLVTTAHTKTPGFQLIHKESVLLPKPNKHSFLVRAENILFKLRKTPDLIDLQRGALIEVFRYESADGPIYAVDTNVHTGLITHGGQKQRLQEVEYVGKVKEGVLQELAIPPEAEVIDVVTGDFNITAKPGTRKYTKQRDEIITKLGGDYTDVTEGTVKWSQNVMRSFLDPYLRRGIGKRVADWSFRRTQKHDPNEPVRWTQRKPDLVLVRANGLQMGEDNASNSASRWQVSVETFNDKHDAGDHRGILVFVSKNVQRQACP